ncbi:hypothetical protein ACVKXF_000619 [Curtobacterium sp. PvP017]
MRFLRGRNPFQFALGALAVVGTVIVVVRWIVSAVSSQTYSYAYIAGAGVSIDLPFIVVVELVTILSFVGWLVVGALLWGPRRTDG